MSKLKHYPGAKTNSGIIPFLVNEIPYHTRYFELCAGSAQLFRHKRRAAVNYLNDINPLVIAELFSSFGHEEEMIRYSTLPLLEFLLYHTFTRNDFIYFDPPYPEDARRSGATLYEFEMLKRDQHSKFLSAVLAVNANITISSRPNELYDEMLKDWRRKEFETMGHRGAVTEVIYMNYEPPTLLHQYDMLGADCWDRQGTTRFKQRFAAKIDRIEPYDRHIMIQQLIEKYPEEVTHFLTVLEQSKK
jgi:16S rRNA G966 N2-methylase RsmD